MIAADADGPGNDQRNHDQRGDGVSTFEACGGYHDRGCQDGNRSESVVDDLEEGSAARIGDSS